MTAKGVTLVSAILCSFMISGCWDYKELDQKAIVGGIGYDLNKDGNITAIASLDQTQSSTGQDTSQGAKAQTQLVIAKAKHFLDAYHLLALQVPRLLYVSHLYSMVFSEAFAKSSSFPEIVDRVTRVGSVRRRTILFVTPDRVEDVFRQHLPAADSTARGLSDLVVQGCLLQLAPHIDINEFVFKSTLPGVDPILPEVHLMTLNGHKVLRAAGIAVFHHGKMAGYLAPKDVRMLLWLMGKTGRCILAFPGLKKKELAHIQTEKIQTSIKTSTRGDHVVADAKIQVTCSLAVYRGDHPLQKTDIQRLESTASQVFRQKLMRAVKTTQSMKVDPVGFGVLVRAQVGSDVWSKRYANWSEEEYPRMTIHIHVKTQISSTGETNDPISEEQAESGSPES